MLARAPGHGTSATLGAVLLVLAAAAVVVAVRRGAAGAARGGAPPENGGDEGAASGRRATALRQGAPVAVAVALVLSIPFAVSGRWGLLGVGFNNDLGLHLAWAEWLRSGFGPAPDAGYPLGPHGLAVAVAAFPGIGLGQAFVGEIFAIGVLTALSALAALPGLGPAGGCSPRRSSPSPTSPPPTSPRAPSRRPPRRSSCSRWRSACASSTSRGPAGARSGRRATARSVGPASRCPGWRSPAASSSPTASPGSPGRSLAAALWSLTLPGVRRALAPRSLLRLLFRPTTLLAIVVLAGLALAATTVGPFGFVGSFNKVAGTNTYGPVSPVEALGVWPTPNYRLEAPGGAHLTGLAGAIGGDRPASRRLVVAAAARPRRAARASPPAPSSTSPRCRPAATTRRPRR